MDLAGEPRVGSIFARNMIHGVKLLVAGGSGVNYTGGCLEGVV